MAIAEQAIAAIARTITPRLAGVTSIAAPIGVCSAMPRRPLAVVTSPTSVWVQCRPVTRIYIDERAEQVADVGGQEIECVQRVGDGDHRSFRRRRARAARENAAAELSFRVAMQEFLDGRDRRGRLAKEFTTKSTKRHEGWRRPSCLFVLFVVKSEFVGRGEKLCSCAPAQDREAPCLEAAIDVGEARFAHPGELVLDRGAAVERHALGASAISASGTPSARMSSCQTRT